MSNTSRSIGAGPKLGQRIDLGIVALGIPGASLEPQAVPFTERVKVRHDLEARLALWVVDCGQVREHIHAALRGIAQEARDLLPGSGFDDDRVVAVQRVRFEHGRAEVLLDEINQGL
jgi:hypothetical protein